MHHPEYIHNGFLILALVCFILAGIGFTFRPPHSTPSWRDFGFACVVAAFLFPFFV